MDSIFAYLNTAKQHVSTAISSLAVSTRLSGDGSAGATVGAGIDSNLESVRAEDRLLGALESGDDKLYDSLINPATGMVFTEPQKFDAVSKSIDREINSIFSQSASLTSVDQARFDELIELRGDVERSHVISSLHHGGIDPSQHLSLVDDLGTSGVADSLVDLNNSNVAINHNTAAAILNGDVRIQTIEDKIIGGVDADGNGLAEIFYVDQNGDGVRDVEIPYGTYGYNPIGSTDIYVFGNDIYGDPHFEQEVQNTIIHETNHAFNPPDRAFADLTPQERIEFEYETEFRAFWVDGTFESVPEAARAEVINQFLVDNYPRIGNEYASNSGFMDIVDNTSLPTGNLDNS